MLLVEALQESNCRPLRWVSCFAGLVQAISGSGGEAAAQVLSGQEINYQGNCHRGPSRAFHSAH